jgi:hypothetical protein
MKVNYPHLNEVGACSSSSHFWADRNRRIDCRPEYSILLQGANLILIPVFQKAKASETVSPLGRNLEVSALIKEVGLLCRQLYQKAICELQRLCVDF